MREDNSTSFARRDSQGDPLHQDLPSLLYIMYIIGVIKKVVITCHGDYPEPVITPFDSHLYVSHVVRP